MEGLRRHIRGVVWVSVLLLLAAVPVISHGDALVEDFWNTAYSVDYDVTVSAPDGGVNFRYGPGAEYGKIQENMIPNGTVLHIEQVAKADNGKNWGFTEYNEYYGWIYLGQTTKVSASSGNAGKTSGTASTPVSADYNVLVKAPDGGVNIRSGPGADYDKLQSNLIPNGTVLHISETAKASNGKDWGYTTYNGVKGWIFLGQTEKTSLSVTSPETEPSAQTDPAQVDPAQDPAAEGSEQAVGPPVVEDDFAPDSMDSDTQALGAATMSTHLFVLAILALVILAIVVTVVLLLARRRR